VGKNRAYIQELDVKRGGVQKSEGREKRTEGAVKKKKGCSKVEGQQPRHNHAKEGSLTDFKIVTSETLKGGGQGAGGRSGKRGRGLRGKGGPVI